MILVCLHWEAWAFLFDWPGLFIHFFQHLFIAESLILRPALFHWYFQYFYWGRNEINSVRLIPHLSCLSLEWCLPLEFDPGIDSETFMWIVWPRHLASVIMSVLVLQIRIWGYSRSLGKADMEIKSFRVTRDLIRSPHPRIRCHALNIHDSWISKNVEMKRRNNE